MFWLRNAFNKANHCRHRFLNIWNERWTYEPRNNFCIQWFKIVLSSTLPHVPKTVRWNLDFSHMNNIAGGIPTVLIFHFKSLIPLLLCGFWIVLHNTQYIDHILGIFFYIVQYSHEEYMNLVNQFLFSGSIDSEFRVERLLHKHKLRLRCIRWNGRKT